MEPTALAGDKGSIFLLKTKAGFSIILNKNKL